MGRAEKLRKQRSLLRGRVEPESLAGVLNTADIEYLKEHDGSLMSLVVREENLMAAAEAVRRNKGAAGIDGITADEVIGHIRKYLPHIQRKLLDASYKPQPVRRVEIPKANGGKRKLGIPVVRDRVVQQAIKQVIEPIIDPHFSPFSYGFRKNRSAHQALKKCAEFYDEGYEVAVDCDLKNCFDSFNHDKLMYYFEQYIQDGAICRIIRRFLTSGVIDLSGTYVDTETGTPQGGVISPLLCNVYLHELDKELTRRGHRFVRYADDFVIFVKSERAGQRVLKSISHYIEKKLKLQINKEKSQVGSPTDLKFLGCLIHTYNGETRYRPTDQAKKKFKATLRRLTRRNRPGTFTQITAEIRRYVQGWINYFGLGYVKGFLQRTQSWLNRRMRQLILKRWKKPKTIIDRLMKYGLDEDSAKRIGYSRKKYWRLSQTPEVHRALTTKRLHKWGLVSLTQIAESAYLRY